VPCFCIKCTWQIAHRMKIFCRKLRLSKDLYDNFLKVVTPECCYRGSSQSFAWIPAKSMWE